MSIHIETGATCPGRNGYHVVMTGKAWVAPDGTFTATGPVSSPGATHGRLTGTLTAKGQFVGLGASGVATNTVFHHQHGKKRRCRSLGRFGAWAVRAAAHPAGPAAPTKPAANLYGTADQEIKG
jgi:hypothetical protein